MTVALQSVTMLSCAYIAHIEEKILSTHTVFEVSKGMLVLINGWLYCALLMFHLKKIGFRNLSKKSINNKKASCLEEIYLAFFF